jgi:membrane protein insertase Oxa1/YidC/SpoIIIJ
VAAKLSPEQVGIITSHVAQLVPEFTPEMFTFATNDTLKALLPHLTTALQATPTYMAHVQPMSGWANINFFLFNITVYIQHNGYLILPVLAGLSQVLMTKLTPGASGAAPVPTGQQAAPGMGGFMKYFFPLFSVFITLTSNAGFALYWVVSNLIATALSFLITKHYDRVDRLEAEAKGAEAVT